MHETSDLSTWRAGGALSISERPTAKRRAPARRKGAVISGWECLLALSVKSDHLDPFDGPKLHQADRSDRLRLQLAAMATCWRGSKRMSFDNDASCGDKAMVSRHALRPAGRSFDNGASCGDKAVRTSAQSVQSPSTRVASCGPVTRFVDGHRETKAVRPPPRASAPSALSSPHSAQRVTLSKALRTLPKRAWFASPRATLFY